MSQAVEIMQPEAPQPFTLVEDYDQLPTPELKTYIRRLADFKEEILQYANVVHEHQVDACLELCTRHDAGNLIPFFLEVKMAWTSEMREVFVKKGADRKVSQAVTGAALGVSRSAVQRDIRRLSGKSGKASPDARTGKSDKPGSKPLPPGVVQHQASVNLNPKVWESFKQHAWSRGVTAAHMLGELVVHEVETPTYEVSVTNDVNTVACRITPATELISRVRRDIEDLTSKRYTLSKTDRNRLITIIKTGLAALEGNSNGHSRQH